MLKKCSGCKNQLPINKFKANKARKDGFQTNCIDCHKKYRREHYIRNRQKYLDKAKKLNNKNTELWKLYKSQFACSKCGEDHPACIEFHHTDPSIKEANISVLARGYSKEKLAREIEKCIPLCSNCHRKEHWVA